MDFDLTEEMEAVRELSARILGDLATVERLAALPEPIDRDAWTRFAQAGLLGVALPEQDGGAGMGYLGAHVVLAEIGRAAAPVPFWETIVLGALPLARFGTAAQREQMIPAVLAGERLLTAALVEESPGDPTALRTRAARTDQGWELSGSKTGVPLAPLAHDILVPAVTEDGAIGVWVVPADAAGVEVSSQEVITGWSYGEVALERATVGDDALLGPLDGTVLDWLLDHAAAGIASLTSGACEAALRLAADYTSRREQFGRPVATFQAVAQRVADAYIDTEGLTLTALQAAWRLSEGLPARDEVAIAKWWAAEAGHRVLHASGHVHGGVGIDRDYPLHRYFALAKQLEFSLGGATVQLLRIGAALAAEPA
jgi:alkylation response protein AidB-like acyl-CoA dehydrogenase